MRAVLLACCLTLLTACSSGPRINHDYHSVSQSRVQYIVLHYTSTDLPHSLALLTQGGVSSHYLIGDQPATIYQLVDDDRRAWHAGESEWQGRTWLNASTIGIELVNQGYEDTPNGRVWSPYSDAQIDALIALLKELVARHQLPLDSIVGHSDIAPQRKVDPGPLLPWKRLADAGLVPWPDAAAVARQQAVFAQQLPPLAWFIQQLQRQGYQVPASTELDPALRNVIAAFQMKYRPSNFDGNPDAETAAMLDVLNQAL